MTSGGGGGGGAAAGAGGAAEEKEEKKEEEAEEESDEVSMIFDDALHSSQCACKSLQSPLYQILLMVTCSIFGHWLLPV